MRSLEDTSRQADRWDRNSASGNAACDLRWQSFFGVVSEDLSNFFNVEGDRKVRGVSTSLRSACSFEKQGQRLQAMPLSQEDLVLLVFLQVAGSSTRCGQILDWVIE